MLEPIIVRTLSIDFNVRPRNPGQPAESAKPIHCVWCADFKINFVKIVTNLLRVIALVFVRAGAHNERRKGRGKEREAPTHLIKN